MAMGLFQSGDRVFHPIYGLGVIEGLMTRDQAGQKIECYRVRISDGAIMSVPLSRAEAVGLRLIANGLKRVVACLHSPAQPLPAEDRLRFDELKSRSQARGPAALPQAVRDLLNHGRACRLTPADQRWLESACERLSAEAAWVDGISLDKARAIIQQEIDRFKLDQAPPRKKHKPGKSASSGA